MVEGTNNSISDSSVASAPVTTPSVSAPSRDRVKEFFARTKVTITITLLILLFVAVYFYSDIFISVHTGNAGVLWRRFQGGTVVDHVYGEGFHIVNPFNKLILYDVRIQEIKHEMYALTINGLDIRVDLSIRVRPQYEFLPLLHQQIGPEYITKVIIPEVESVIRAVIGKYRPEELFTTQPGILERLVFNSLAEIGQKFVTLDDVIIRRIELPESIKGAIEAKLKQQQLMQEYEFRIVRENKEKERKLIEAEGIKLYQTIVNESITDKLLTWKGIEATLELAKSTNSKIVVVGNNKNGLPIILNPDK